MSWSPQYAKPIRVRSEAMSGWGRPREGHSHAGIDIPVPVGTPVHAIADGTAVRVQATNAGDPAGIWVGIKHADGVVSRYMHLSKAQVSLGQKVRQGQQVGLSGNTGIHNSGPHLHIDLKAPTTLLPAIAAAGGQPSGGWGPSTAYGTGIPAEPWIPVDSYSARTKTEAQANRIPLYRASAGGGLSMIALAFVGWGAWKLLR